MIGNHKVSFSDEYFMELAIEQAVIAQARGEVPVGALFVEEKEILVASANASGDMDEALVLECFSIDAFNESLGKAGAWTPPSG